MSSSLIWSLFFCFFLALDLIETFCARAEGGGEGGVTVRQATGALHATAAAKTPPAGSRCPARRSLSHGGGAPARREARQGRAAEEARGRGVPRLRVPQAALRRLQEGRQRQLRRRLQRRRRAGRRRAARGDQAREPLGRRLLGRAAHAPRAAAHAPAARAPERDQPPRRGAAPRRLRRPLHRHGAHGLGPAPGRLVQAGARPAPRFAAHGAPARGRRGGGAVDARPPRRS